MNNLNNPTRRYIEARLGRISDSYWYRVKKWMITNKNCTSINAADEYLNRYSISKKTISDTAVWLEKAPDKVKFADFLLLVERIYKIKWVRSPGRTTIYSWFHRSKIDQCRKNFSYTKIELIPVVEKVLESRLIENIGNDDEH
jgi:hypothetical protein